MTNRIRLLLLLLFLLTGTMVTSPILCELSYISRSNTYLAVRTASSLDPPSNLNSSVSPLTGVMRWMSDLPHQQFFWILLSSRRYLYSDELSRFHVVRVC